jgi:hypothetical protein
MPAGRPSEGGVRLLIGVISCGKHHARREACRLSWVPAAGTAAATGGEDAVDVVFVVGVADLAEPWRGGDTLYVPCPDDYGHLPRKTWWLARAARDRGYDYLFKCDDDTFVHVGRLVDRARAGAAFAGHEVVPGVASGGAGYLLDAASAAVLAERMAGVAAGAEDVAASRALAAAGVRLDHDPRFWPWNNRVPTVFDGQISAHYVDPVALPRLAASLRSGSGPPAGAYRLVEGSAGYGAVGVRGFRGFTANGTAAPELPPDSAAGAADYISAHATSRMVVDVARPVLVRGLLDLGAVACGSPVDFTAGGRLLGTLAGPGEATAEVRLPPGTHRLDAAARGHNARCYSVWRVREAAAVEPAVARPRPAGG